MKKLGIIGAMDVEVATLKDKMENKRIHTVAGSDYCEGKLEGMDAVVVQCGVGKVNAALCAQILCSCFGVPHIVNTGIAGSLNAQLDIGDFVISQDAVYHDMDATNFGYPMCQVPGLSVLSFPADEMLVSEAFRAADIAHPGHVRVGRVATGDQFISDTEKRIALGNEFNALACEMEGGAVGHTCYRNKIPFAILRCISDDLTNSTSMDYETFKAFAAAKTTTVLSQFIKAM